MDSLTIAPLRSLSYTPIVFDAVEINALARLPLIKLEVALQNSEIELPDDLQPSTTIRTLEGLTLFEPSTALATGEWDVKIGRFVKSCPNLRSLTLVDSLYPRFEKFLEALVGGVPFLTKLEFDNPALEEDTFCSFTHLYPRFPTLTFLSLSEGTAAPELASQLRHLPSLSILRLGPGAHNGFESADNLCSLVQGSTKPPALKLLILECFGAAIGYRCDMEDQLTYREIDNPRFKVGWSEPNLTAGIIDQGECRQLLELARANSVQVEGDIYAAVIYSSSWNLEIANRHVLYAYQNQTPSYSSLWENFDQAARLREIDFAKLHPDNLKLVKIDLPEEGWFQLSLVSGGNEVE
ncbi:hypothetical protein JCM3765_001805 [Sporobolomyces pararoseus]